MITAYCSNCASSFTRKSDEAWKTLCFACWKKSKATTSTLGESANHLRHELYDALEEAARLRRMLMQVERRSAIPPDVLKKLLHLAHPDKHSGSKIATEATQWLLSQREASR